MLANLGAVTVSYASDAGGDAVEIKGIFDEDQVSVAQGRAGIEDPTPLLFVRLEDCPEDVEDAEANPLLTIVAAEIESYVGRQFRIHERDSDDMGGIFLYLHEVEE